MPRRSLWSGLAAGTLTIALSTVALAPAQAAPAGPAAPAQNQAQNQAQTQARSQTEVCPGVKAPTFRGAEPNAEYNDLFKGYANNRRIGSHWTGADGTYSTRLPNGKLAFVFSDTFLGTIRPDGSRSPTTSDGGTTPFINNSFVVKSGRKLSTVHDGTRRDPKAPMPPSDKKHWYWAGDAITSGGIVQGTYQEYERFGDGIWDWRWKRNVMARYAPGRLGKPISVRPLPSSSGVAWASWLERAGKYIYIYGVEDKGGTKYMHLARVRGQHLTGRWEYLTQNRTWSAKESDSARVMPGVANEYSVHKVGRVYMLLTQDTTVEFNTQIVAYYSCSPQGPFVGKTPIYNTPETGEWGSYGNKNVFTYNAHAHPEISSDRKIVASYNVNSLKNTDLYKDASIYMPRFLTLKFD